jgi:hypothetical protein
MIDSMISDHHAIHFDMECAKPHPPRKTITYRKTKDLDIDLFKTDILSSDLYHAPANNLADKVNQYDLVLKALMDKHAPEMTKNVAHKEPRPWMNDKILTAKKRRRRMERRWRKTRLTVHREAYQAERQNVKDLIDNEKAKFYNGKISDCEGDQKKLFSIVDDLLNRGKPTSLPQHDSLSDLVETFSDFFTGKIETIRNDLSDLEATTEPLSCPPVSTLLPPSDTNMDVFKPSTEEEISKIIKGSSKASCKLDPLPTRLLSEHFLPELLPVITDIVNSSLESGDFPVSLKTALVKPLLKKVSLDPEILKHYRPISNLSFLSKIIERVAAKRLFEHMTENGLHDIMQSAYKPCHSTETALLRVQNDLRSAIDKKSGVFLALLDLSAAFDTIDHKILLTFLENTIGIRGSALNWFSSYLSGRTQCISIDNVMSHLIELLFGVPQGSVMGPFKFCVYTLPIGAIIRSHGLGYHIYADDTQIYVAFESDDPKQALDKLNACLTDIRSWMIQNKLKINDSKTEFLILASPNAYSKLNSDLELHVGNSHIKPAPSAKNLGVIFDKHLKMEAQVTGICRSANFHLRNIGAIRHLLTDSSSQQLVHSFITSRLDYCNSLLIGLPDSQLNRLQRIQNNAARVVSKIKKFDHVSPVLHELHWLPVHKRIVFKTLLLTYRCVNGMAPQYLSDLITPYASSRHLRSSDKQLLHVPTCRLKSYGEKCFSVAAPKAWNNLPLHIRMSSSLNIFKTKLKTYLF